MEHINKQEVKKQMQKEKEAFLKEQGTDNGCCAPTKPSSVIKTLINRINSFNYNLDETLNHIENNTLDISSKIKELSGFEIKLDNLGKLQDIEDATTSAFHELSLTIDRLNNLQIRVSNIYDKQLNIYNILKEIV